MLIKNGLVIDPKNNIFKKFDLLIENGKIIKISDDLNEKDNNIIDAGGMWVCPGFIDLHAHLRDPGQTYKEDIYTGSRAAAMGGFTTICCMPNTYPVIDGATQVMYVNETAKRDSVINILPIGAITKGQKGEELADIAEMSKAGICAISEDGKSVGNSQLLKEAFIIAEKLGLPVFSHCEDIDLVNGGCMNESESSKKLGLKGISNDSENVIIARDIALAESTGAKVHICHVSTGYGADLIEDAKKRGMRVTGEAAPHHFTLSDKALETPDTNYKMSPPLRSEKDVLAIRNAVKSGVIDAIATDHAPHAQDEKAKPFETAPFGITGLETAFPLAYNVFIKPGLMTPLELIKRFTSSPADILGINKGSLGIGQAADIVIIDPAKIYKYDSAKSQSKSRNTPFNGLEMQGMIMTVICGGKIIVMNNSLI